MPRSTRAVIDVGTNSVKLLVAQVEGESVSPLFEDSEQTRLGQGFYETHVLQTAAIEFTARAVSDFTEMARRMKAEAVRLIATSAARDALNKAQLEEALQAASGLPLEIITGEQEADLAFQGVTTDPAFRGQDLLVIDVGGGSTEFIIGRDEHRSFAKSFPLGTVRVLEKLAPSDPPEPEEHRACAETIRNFLRMEVLPKLEGFLGGGAAGLHLVGTGGTSTILARIELKLKSYERDRLEGLVLSREQLAAQEERLWSLPLAERRQITGLPAKRADVILPGVLIYKGIMDVLGFNNVKISTRGLRFAAVR